MEEVWKPIEDYPGYEVSNIGRVRSWLGRGQYGKRLQMPLVRKLYKCKEGYWILTLHRCGVRHVHRVHQLVIEKLFYFYICYHYLHFSYISF